MKKILSSLLILITILLSSCQSSRLEVIGSVNAEDTKPEAPKLSVEVTEEMDFFKDGYEIVTLETLADGDTTTFTLKSGSYTTRYLAIDTPETSNGLDPWGLAAKRYVNDLLTNADTIILEKDPILIGSEGEADSTEDKYGRLLAHVWVDGELLQYKVVEESLAYVNYLYYPYKYNDTLIKLEAYVRKSDNRRIHNKADLDPEYDYSDTLYRIALEDLNDDLLNKRVEITGIVTGSIGGNAYLQSSDGSKAVYCYSKNTPFKAFSTIGNEVKVRGRYTLYNGIPEISSFEAAPIKVSEGNDIITLEGGTHLLCQDNMSQPVMLKDAVVRSISGGNITIEDEYGRGIVRIDRATGIEPSLLSIDRKYDFTGNVSVYNGVYQLMLRTIDDIGESL